MASTNAGTSESTSLSRNQGIGRAVEFGRHINRSVFFSTQFWLVGESDARAAARDAWADLKIAARALTANAMKAQTFEELVGRYEDGFWALAETLTHLEYLRGLDEALAEAGDFSDHTQDRLFFLHTEPATNWRDALLSDLDSRITAEQVRGINLGEYLDQLIRGRKVWHAMYSSRTAETYRAREPRTLAPEDFSRQLDSGRQGFALALEGFNNLPTTMVSTAPRECGTAEQKLLQQRLSELSLPWDVAETAFYSSDVSIESDGLLLVSDSSLELFIGALDGTPSDVPTQDYLGLKLVGRAVVDSLKRSVKLGPSSLELMHELLKVGDVGLTRSEVIRLKGGAVTDNAVDQAKRELNNKLTPLGIAAVFDNGPLRLVRRPSSTSG